MNPLASLLPALATALAGLEVEGTPVFVGQFLPANNPGHYVLIEQPTDTDAGGGAECPRFTCTVLLDVVTQFPTDLANSLPVESLVSQIHARLRRKRLALGDNWDCQPGSVEPAIQLRETDGQKLILRRPLRYRWDIRWHTPASPPAVAEYTGFDYVLQGPDGSFLLA